MSLEADAVDLYAVSLDELDDSHSASVLVGSGLEVVVVVKELGVGVGCSSHLEGHGDIGFANDLEEYVTSVRAILVECCEWELAVGLLQRWLCLDVPSLTTSQCVHLPLYLVTSVVMWFCITLINVALLVI